MSKENKKGKALLAVLLLLVILVLALYLIIHMGLFGLGGNGAGSTGDGISTSAVNSPDDRTPPAETTAAAAAETTAETVTETTPEAVIPDAEITVHESEYLYQNRSIELDALLAEIDALADGTRIVLHDDGASLNAYEALTKALSEKGIAYTEETGAAAQE